MKTQFSEGELRPEKIELADSAVSTLLTDIFTQENLGINDALEAAPAFDPIEIRDLIRRSTDAGKHPAKLILGHLQVESYRELLWVEYGEEPPKNLRDNYFLGLQVIEEDTPDKLVLAGEKAHDAWDTQLPPLWQDEDSPTNSGQAA